MKSITIKMDNEKLVRVSLECNENIISSINISGDFFIHPETGIDYLEGSITGRKIDREILKETLDKTVNENELELIGISTGTIIYCILELAGKNEK